jgi:hypothetical protein
LASKLGSRAKDDAYRVPTAAQVDRMWARIAARKNARFWPKISAISATSAIAATGTLVLVAAALVIGLRMRTEPVPRPAERANASVAAAVGRIEVAAATPRELTLPDGTRVTLEPATTLRVDEATVHRIVLTVLAGIAHFDVPKAPGRTFSVWAAGIEAAVVGTRFRVGIDETAKPVTMTLVVDEGKVQVRRPSHAARMIAAGESWTGPQSGPEEADGDEHASALPKTQVARRGHPIALAPTTADTGDSLFERGVRARLEGRAQDAATAFDEVRRKFRSSGQAGLAAFQLGRIRLDNLSDPLGAADALSDAIRLSPGGPFREDAQALLVQALHQGATVSRCRQARDEYLGRYPTGAHAAMVAHLCGDRR